MAETSNRLGLIQRAAQRLKSGGEGMIASLPLRERDLSSEFPKSNQFSGRQKTGLPPHQPEIATTSGITKSVRLNFAEMRRLGMLTPDNMMNSTISFEFRTVKRKLLANARDPNSDAITKNMVMVTSALPGEGKTFTTTNLALALAAERDIHVLLVDADVIKPTIGRLFESASGKGLTDLLNGNCEDVGEIIHRCSDLPNLSVIFSGERDARTPELISSRRTTELCLEMSRRYSDRIVIFDTPPVLASAEPANLARHMHQIVMVVAAGAANRSQVQSALDHVSACPNISLVFNKAPKWHKNTGDSYYYYYGGNGVAGNGAAVNGANDANGGNGANSN